MNTELQRMLTELYIPYQVANRIFIPNAQKFWISVSSDGTELRWTLPDTETEHHRSVSGALQASQWIAMLWDKARQLETAKRLMDPVLKECSVILAKAGLEIGEITWDHRWFNVFFAGFILKLKYDPNKGPEYSIIIEPDPDTNIAIKMNGRYSPEQLSGVATVAGILMDAQSKILEEIRS